MNKKSKRKVTVMEKYLESVDDLNYLGRKITAIGMIQEEIGQKRYGRVTSFTTW